MTERTILEQRLADGLNDIAGPPRAVDATAVAERAAAAAVRSGGLVTWLPGLLRDNRPAPVALRIALVAAALLLAAGVLIVAGMLPHRQTVVETCDGVRDIADARLLEEGAGSPAWTLDRSVEASQAIVAIGSNAADGGNPADVGSIVLIDARTGAACRLVATHLDVVSANRTRRSGPSLAVAPAPTGTAVAILLVDRALVWSRLGLVDVWRGAEGSGVPRVAWAPDASSLALWDPESLTGRLRFIAAEGLPRSPIDFGGPISGAAWSPDGGRIAVSHQPAPLANFEGIITIADVRTGRTGVLADGDPLPQVVRAWRGDDVLVVKRISPALPYRVQLVPMDDPLRFIDGAASLPGGAYASPHGWWNSPDGGWVAVTPERSTAHDLLVVDALTALQRTTIASGVGAIVGFDVVAWSPDSRTLAFTTADSPSGTPTGLWTVSVDGSGLRQLAGPGFSLVDGSWIGGGSR